MRVATNLSDLADLHRYSLHPLNDDSQFLKQVIDLFYPQASFAGYVEHLDPVEGTTIITVDPRWRVAMREKSLQADLVVFPPTDVVSWEFWYFGREILADCIPGKPAKLPLASLVKFLTRWEPPILEIQPDGNAAVIAGDQYNIGIDDIQNAFRMPIDFVYSQLGNAESQAAYGIAIRGNPQEILDHYVKSVFSKTQYLQYTSINPGDVILSIGIDEGFELPYLTAELQGQGHLYGIDPMEFTFLGRYTWQNVSTFKNIVTSHVLAIGGTRGTASIPLVGTMARGSALNHTLPDTPQVHVPSCTVDDFVNDNALGRVDFIKIDIEGGEEYMIEGMLQTIMRFRPQIAIAVYHSYHHLWSLPMRLMSICPDYEFYFDHYSFVKWDSVFYAVPKERSQPRFRESFSPLLVLQ